MVAIAHLVGVEVVVAQCHLDDPTFFLLIVAFYINLHNNQNICGKSAYTIVSRTPLKRLCLNQR
ncbi:hypothetical protein [Fischerella thermalis]|uniref:hypothetical protein n=1 Tax=Fischerella thermalis TaxID=372787 RepID=UPI0015E158D7|nr:hypothetical protein [Fischerella thermalis]